MKEIVGVISSIILVVTFFGAIGWFIVSILDDELSPLWGLLPVGAALVGFLWWVL